MVLFSIVIVIPANNVYLILKLILYIQQTVMKNLIAIISLLTGTLSDVSKVMKLQFVVVYTFISTQSSQMQ